MAKSISDIDTEIQRLQTQRQAILTREQKAKRDKETRQKAILGGWIMANEPDTMQRIVARLARPQDRAAFDLDEASIAQPDHPAANATAAASGISGGQASNSFEFTPPHGQGEISQFGQPGNLG
ncbi:hypothetical protein [Polaromonas sp.]|uniref:hypothetical protein n=1 Tax=Polaromonas sp. TaxID=1869339 RepID=UPI00352B2FFC